MVGSYSSPDNPDSAAGKEPAHTAINVLLRMRRLTGDEALGAAA